MSKVLIGLGLALLAFLAIKVNATLDVAEGSSPILLSGSVTRAVAAVKSKQVTLKEYNLGATRIVYVVGVIGEINSAGIAKDILRLGKDPQPITVVINSPGGSVIDGAEIISAMEAAKGPVNTLCVQLCASMAAMIHQYGTHRLMINRSLVMFHPATGGMQGEVDKMNSRLGTLKRYIEKMDQNAAKRAKIPFETFRNMYQVELWLDAEDALAQGFADDVVFVRGSDGAKLYTDIPLDGKSASIFPTIANPIRFDWM